MEGTAVPVGHLEVITGSMFSGKTEELIRRTRRALIARRRVLIVKPAIDDRYAAEAVFSHDGRRVDAVPVPVEEPERIFVAANECGAEVVSIDEAQFFTQGLVAAVRRLVDSGRRVIVSGLDLDFARRPFGCMPELMAMADEVTKLKAICVRCGEPAMFTQRLIDGRPAAEDDPLVVIGGAEAYEARCRRCHEVAPARRREAEEVA
ncbi:MAG: thymidine kinase, partial [Firmicutes bacterium]|nr:thymidine kinase [Bacillota bacterium]